MREIYAKMWVWRMCDGNFRQRDESDKEEKEKGTMTCVDV